MESSKYITVITDPETPIHRGKGMHNMLFVKLSQEVHKNAYVALRKKTSNECYDLVRESDSST